MARRHEDRPTGQRRTPAGGRGGGGSGSGGRRGSAGGSGGQRPGPKRRGDGAAGPFAGKRRPPANRRSRGLKVTPTAAPPKPVDGKVRLNRYLAMSGVCSRRAADEVIAAGRVELNGVIVTELGTTVDPRHDDVRVDGERVRQEKLVYVLLNKPKGVVCTNARHEQKKRVVDLLPQVRGRLFTVGRLDLDSEGLILLTNDGDFALKLTHPRYGVPKLYSVQVRGRVAPESLKKARGGVWLAEGPTAGMQIKVDHAGNDRSYLKVQLREGKNREIRRVFAKLGHPVIELKRVRIGDLSLHGLSEGEWRFLQAHEVQGLLAAAAREDREEGEA